MLNYNSWTVGRKLWLLSGFGLVNLLIVGALSFWETSTLITKLKNAFSEQIPTVRYMTLTDMMHDGIRANVYHAVISSGSKDQALLKEVRAERDEFATNISNYLASLKKLGLSGEVERDLQASLPLVDTYVKSAHEIVEIALKGDVEKAIASLPTFQEDFEKLEEILGSLGEKIEKGGEQSIKESYEISEFMKKMSLIFITTSLIVGIGIAFFSIRNLQKSLKKVIADLVTESDTVTSSASTLSKAADNLSTASAQQASALQQTAASIEEITAMVKKTSDNSQNLQVTAQQSHKSASRGQASISEMLSSMTTISDSHSKIMSQVESGNQQITEIVKVIGEIGNKTKVINDIVFQTKLLSFNASVEAARAGEHGKGFAVVAEEVGNLAQMSGNAAKEISDMLNSSIEKVENIVKDSKRKVEGLIADGKEKIEAGSHVAKQCGSVLQDIVKHSSDVGSMIGEITTAIQEQNQGIHEISKAIQLLDQSTHENSVTSKNTSETSISLLNQSQQLNAIVTRLRQMVDKGDHEKTSPSKDVLQTTQPAAKVVALKHPPKKKAPAAPTMKTPPVNVKKAVGSDVIVNGIPSENDPRFEDV